MHSVKDLQDRIKKQIDMYLQEANLLKMRQRVKPDPRLRDQYFGLIGKVQACQELVRQLDEVEPVVVQDRRKEERRRSC